MESLKRFDSWLIEGPYQGVVNLSGKKPSWWVEQCGLSLFVFAICRFIFKGKHEPAFDVYVILICKLMFSAMLIFVARVPALMKPILGDYKFRILMLILTIFVIIGSFKDPILLGLFKILSEVSLISAYYFSVCDSPKRREPKRHLSTKTA